MERGTKVSDWLLDSAERDRILTRTIRIRESEVDVYIAMNRFRVRKGHEADFEKVWKNRDTRLREVDGVVEFHLLSGPEGEEHTLYASHTIWRSRKHFEAWTHSEAFHAAHRDAGDHRGIYLGHPEFEGFEVV